MTRISSQGWLLYAGQLGVVAADVLHAEMEATRSMLNVTSIASPVNKVGSLDVTFKAQLGGEFDWHKNPTPSGPPNLGALLMLARKYPDEYRRLCEAEDVLKALDW